MLVFPAVDIYDHQVVRLFKGDYNQMTVYGDSPLAVAQDFAACGATCIHMVDLQGAKNGTTPNFEEIETVARCSGLFVEVGGGIRSMDTVRRYLDAGVGRVIIGTAAVTDQAFLEEALAAYGERIAVGVDIKDGKVAIKGWTATADWDVFAFCEHLEALGVRTIICTDISKDGVLAGTNRDLYRELTAATSLDVIASGGVSSLDDVAYLKGIGMYGAIIGKAYYEGAIDLAQAVALA